MDAVVVSANRAHISIGLHVKEEDMLFIAELKVTIATLFVQFISVAYHFLHQRTNPSFHVSYGPCLGPC